MTSLLKITLLKFIFYIYSYSIYIYIHILQLLCSYKAIVGIKMLKCY